MPRVRERGLLDVAVDLVVTILVVSAVMAALVAALTHDVGRKDEELRTDVQADLRGRHLLLLQTTWDPRLDGLEDATIPAPLRAGMPLLELLAAAVAEGWVTQGSENPHAQLLADILARSYGVAYPDADVAVLLTDGPLGAETTHGLLVSRGEVTILGPGAIPTALPTVRSSQAVDLGLGQGADVIGIWW